MALVNIVRIARTLDIRSVHLLAPFTADSVDRAPVTGRRIRSALHIAIRGPNYGGVTCPLLSRRSCYATS